MILKGIVVGVGEIKPLSKQKFPANHFVLGTATATVQSNSANYQEQELESRADWPVVIKPGRLNQVWWSGGQDRLRIVLC